MGRTVVMRASASLHQRLGAHFHGLRNQSEEYGNGAPIFALEHALSETELNLLHAEVCATIRRRQLSGSLGCRSSCTQLRSATTTPAKTTGRRSSPVPPGGQSSGTASSFEVRSATSATRSAVRFSPRDAGLETGSTVKLKGTVKGHEVYHEVAQTTNRLEIDQPAPPGPAWRRAAAQVVLRAGVP